MNQDTEAVVIFAIGAAILIALVGIFGLKDRPKKRDRTSTLAIDDSIDWPDDGAREIAERALHGPELEAAVLDAGMDVAAYRAARDERFAKHRIAEGMTTAGRARLGRG